MFVLHLRSFRRGGNINVAEGAVKSLALLERDVDFERCAVVKVFVGASGGVANDGQEVDGEDDFLGIIFGYIIFCKQSWTNMLSPAA